MIKLPSFHQCTFPTTNIPSIPPFPTLPLTPQQTIFPIYSLYFWALWFAIQILRGYHFGPLSTFRTHLPSWLILPTLVFLVIPSLFHLPSPLCSWDRLPAMEQSSYPLYLLSLGVSLMLCYFIFHKWVQSFCVCPSLSDSFHLAWCLLIFSSIKLLLSASTYCTLWGKWQSRASTEGVGTKAVSPSGHRIYIKNLEFCLRGRYCLFSLIYLLIQ